MGIAMIKQFRPISYGPRHEKLFTDLARKHIKANE